MKKIFIPRYIFAGFVFITLGLGACKTKQVTETSTTQQTDDKINSAAELLAKIDSSTHHYANLNIRFAAKIKTAKNENSIRGKLKIRRDSCVWVSALPLGLEAARILATKNETGLVNFLQKEYFQGGYDLLSRQVGYDLDYDMLQSALTGAPVFYADRKTYRFDNDRKNGYYFSPYDKNTFEKITEGKEGAPDGANAVQAMWFDKALVLPAKNVMYDVAQKRYLEIVYSNYVLTGKDYFPANIDIVIRTPKETMLFNIEYAKVEHNVADMEYPFSIPASYKKMDVK